MKNILHWKSGVRRGSMINNFDHPHQLLKMFFSEDGKILGVFRRIYPP